MQLVQNSDSVIKTEILNIYMDYQRLPNRIQNDLSFKEYMIFYLEQLNKTDMAIQRYLELAQDLFAKEQHTGVYEEVLIDQNYPLDDLEKEEQTITRDEQPTCNFVEDSTRGTSFFVGDLEVSLDRKVEEIDYPQGKDHLEHLYDEPDIPNTHGLKLEEPPKITLQDNRQFQQSSNEMHTLRNQLRVSEDMVVASLVHYDRTHELVDELYRRIPREAGRDWNVDVLQEVKIALETMKSDYLYLLTDRDYILKIAEIHAEQANKGKVEIDELNRELKHVRMTLDETRFALQGAENQIKFMNQSWEHEDRMRHKFFLEVIDELESIQQTYDLDSCPKQLSNKTSDHFQFIDNPLFEVDADWMSDNPLFMMDEEVSFVCLEEEEIDFRPWNMDSNLNSDSGTQFRNDESTSVTYQLFNPNIFFDSNPLGSWVIFLHQLLSNSWWSSYVRVDVIFPTSFNFVAPMYLGVLQGDDDGIGFDVLQIVVLAYEQLISYINHLGQIFTLYWVTHGPLICFYLIITAERHNRVWDPGVDRLYPWMDEDFMVVVVLIRVDQFTGAGAEFF